MTIHQFLKYFIFVFGIVLYSGKKAVAQLGSPVQWTVSAQAIDHETYEIQLKAKIQNGFYIYAHDIADDAGPIPTTINFTENKDYQKIGGLTYSGKREEAFDPTFEVHIAKFKKEVTFKQKVKLFADQVTIQGFYEAQACNEQMCFPPDGDDFKLTLKRKEIKTDTNVAVVAPLDSPLNDEPIIAETIEEAGEETYQSEVSFNWDRANTTCVASDQSNADGLWLIFTLGFLGGLIALLTPCVFPMIPLTVSYFTKGGKDRKKGVQQAALYGISIVLIYVLLGLSITLLFGADALNVMSTSAFFNLLFFTIFIIFALSFFGLFEITLPSSWANKTDQLSTKSGFVGIFFMAFTLALVSFSCTGPIIGSLLVQAATDQGPSIGIFKIKPIVGMLGFSIALALPFTLFALFPQGLKELPKSGGWLSKVKVILGLLELAFAFKFLSVVDLTQGWGILRWELFMGIWIILFLITGFYALGIFSKIKTPNIIRIFGVVCIGFALYMLKNTLTYTPIPLLSGLAPSTHYNYFNKDVHEIADTKDFDEALALAKAQNKPIFIDFTGYGCVNCREMEEQVWIQKNIQDLMSQYVVVSLYVDDRTALPESEQYSSAVSGKMKKIKTIGNKWTDFEIRHFQKASQPYYVVVDANMNVLNTPIGYSDASSFQKFLECGLSEFAKQ